MMNKSTLMPDPIFSKLAEVNLDEMQAVIREYLESPGGSLIAED